MIIVKVELTGELLYWIAFDCTGSIVTKQML